MPSEPRNLSLLFRIRNVFVGLKIPGKLDIEILRELDGQHKAGIRLLRNRAGKVSFIAKESRGVPLLCSLTSDILSAKDLRLLISSKLSGDFIAFGEEATTPKKTARPLNLPEKLAILEKELRSIKRTKLPVPACVDRLKRIRRFTRHLDKLIARVNAKVRKMEYFYLQTHRAAERADKAASKALRVANSRMDEL